MGMTSALLSMNMNGLGMPGFSISGFTFPHWLYTNAELLPLLPALLIVGGFIILTLTYVSWRKYKGEREKLREKKKRDKLVD